MKAVIESLARVVGVGGLLQGSDVRNRAAGLWIPEGIRAQAIVRPRSTGQLSAALAICNESGQSVVPHGGLTGLVQGAMTSEDDIVVSLERMKEIEEIDPLGRTMTVQAGVTLQTVQTTAGEAGMMFPLDLGARGSCTIGGNVSTNAGGNRVIRYGMTRDLVLGLEAVLADGTVLSSLNRMIKNNAGYDLKQLFIGTEGTLGIVTRVVLRLYEQPGSENTALVAVKSLDAVSGFLKHTDAGLGGNLSAFEVMWNGFYTLVTSPPADNTPPISQDYPFYILVEALGSDQHSDQARFEQVMAGALEEGLIVDAVIAQSGNDRNALWALRDDVEQTMRHGEPFIFDVSLPITEIEAYTEAVSARLDRDWGDYHCWIFGHLADGNLHLVVAVGTADDEARRKVEAAVYRPLQAIGGSVSAEHGIGLEKKAWLSLSRSAEEIATMQRLKAALDPNDILNPGKVFA